MLKDDLIARMVTKELEYRPSLFSMLKANEKPLSRGQKFKRYFSNKWNWIKDVYRYSKYGCDC